jgi:murein L,D-transpeptidase YcbB/YkuD
MAQSRIEPVAGVCDREGSMVLIRVRRVRGLTAVLVAAAVAAGACSGSAGGGVEAAQARVTKAEAAVQEAEAALDRANGSFCSEAKDYIVAIDRYGKVFSDAAATVGDVRALGADLGQPRASTASSAQAVLDAHDALNVANRELADARAALAVAQASASGTPPPSPAAASSPPISSPSVPAATVDRVRKAEADFEAASKGITDQTPLVDATETFTSAAFALQVAWLNLFADAGCLTDEKSKEADAAIRDYTAALQTDLKTAGYYAGEVDGVYGSETVKAVEDLQTAAGLPVTGLVDRATAAALDQAVANKGASAAAEDAIEATAVQTTLKLAGYWPGAIDGQWTPELTAAVKQFQTALGVKPTGVFDAATLAAIEEALSAPPTQTPPSTTQPPTASPSPTA